MSTFDELKDRARKLEETGDLLGALGVYDELLRQCEMDPESSDHGAGLYVQTGDLRRRLGQPARSFAAYQKAAELYAQRGVGKKVSELCVRMINVVPAAGDAYLRYAGQLLEHEHVDAALEVLKEFASKAAIESVTDQLNAVVSGSSIERKARLAQLLAGLEENSESQTAAALRVSQELYQTVGPDEDTRPQPTKTRTPKPVIVDHATPSSLHSTSTGYSTSSSVARPDFSGFNWKVVGGGVGIVGILGLGLITIGSFRGRESPTVAVTDTAAVSSDVPEIEESTTRNNQPVVQATPPVAQAAPPVAQARESVTPPSPTPTTTDTAATTTSVTTPIVNATTTTPIATDTAATVAAVPVITEPMVVESLAVQSIEQVAFRGLQGFRVVHLLDSGVQFIVESYPVDSSAASNYPVGTLIVNVVPPDTTVSIVRPDEEHLVFASGVVPEDSARILIGLLRVRTPPN